MFYFHECLLIVVDSFHQTPYLNIGFEREIYSFEVKVPKRLFGSEIREGRKLGNGEFYSLLLSSIQRCYWSWKIEVQVI